MNHHGPAGLRTDSKRHFHPWGNGAKVDDLRLDPSPSAISAARRTSRTMAPQVITVYLYPPDHFGLAMEWCRIHPELLL